MKRPKSCVWFVELCLKTYQLDLLKWVMYTPLFMLFLLSDLYLPRCQSIQVIIFENGCKLRGITGNA